MAEARKCDRCGKYYDPDTKHGWIRVRSVINSVEDCDLCEDCCEQLSKWLENKDMKPVIFEHGVMGNSIKE